MNGVSWYTAFLSFNGNASFLIIGFFCFIIQSGFGQDQKVADSLAKIYQQDTLEGTAKLKLLNDLSFNEVNDLGLSLKYAEELIALSKRENNNSSLANGYLQKGTKHRLTGDLEIALDAFFKSADIAMNAENIKTEGSAYLSIADVYSIMGNANNAENYYNKAIRLLRTANDSILLASALLNAGDEFFNRSKYYEALQKFEESGQIFEDVNYLVGTAYNLGNIGMVYAEQGKDVLAESNINEAIIILEELGDFYPISVYLTYMSDIYLRKDDFYTALGYTKRSLELAITHGLKEQISEANLQLSELYEQTGNLEESYKYYKDHIAYRDSINNIESVQQMADLRTNFEVSQKQIEVDLLNEQKKSQQVALIASVITGALIFLLAIGLYRRFIFIKKTNLIIESERNKAEILLLNILPEETAQELKEKGKVEAKKFDSVTVLFTDFKEFTKLAENVEPEQLIKSIDFYFKEFDAITTKYGLEKIKTIGDSYMCAGGLPTVNQTHASDVIHAAKEMIDMVGRVLDNQNDLIHFEIRVGVHTGPVVAGIVGIKKWQYDIWGDTVNIASRMESKSESGMVNMSETTYNEIKNEFSCECRGELEVKNHDPLKMYFLSY